MIILLVTLLAFVLPVLYVLYREWKLNKKAEAVRDGVTAAPKKKEPFNPVAVAKVALVLLLVGVPSFFLSDASFSFFSPDVSALKVGFKHTGKRIFNCDEANLIKQEGERYRAMLKESKHVQMSNQKLAGCPRERYPVAVEVYMDGKKLLDKNYPPTGLKKDMASYVYEEFIIEPGTHKFLVKLYDTGKKDSPDFVFEDTADIKPRDIKLITFDDKANKLILE